MHKRSAWLDAMARHAAQRPSAIAVAEVSPDGQVQKELSWKSFAHAGNARARVLSRVVPPGATVLAAWPSGIELAAWCAGAIAAGVRLVLMHPMSGPAECAAVCERAGVTAALAADELLSRVRDRAAGIQRLAPSCELPEDPDSDDSPFTAESEPGSLVLGSSGTTGLPKLVLRESDALDADAHAVVSGLSLTPDDSVLCVAPLCHSYGVDMLLGTLLAGATLRVMTAFDPAGAARQLASGITVLPGVPFVYESLSRLADTAGARAEAGPPVHHLRLAVSAGSPLSTRVRADFTDRWRIEIGQLYGATELGTVSVSIPGEPDFDASSIGRPLPGVSFRIVDVDDPRKMLDPDQEGQLAVKARSMLSAYLDADLELIDGHLLTGDLARMDSRGRATITGRLKLSIESGGFKVNPLEVEAMLLDHPEVAECAVVPLALSDTIQRLLALVVARDQATPPSESELRQFLRERIAPAKIPRRFKMVGSLPRSPLGKLLRDRLTKGPA